MRSRVGLGGVLVFLVTLRIVLCSLKKFTSSHWELRLKVGVSATVKQNL